MTYTNPATLTNWVPPHSLQWYAQLSRFEQQYTYSWDSTVDVPNGETIYDEKAKQIAKEQRGIDIGCADGSFTQACATVAAHMVGIDVATSFINTAQLRALQNVQFIAHNIRDRLPFEPNTLDCAFIRKGPTSAYPLIQHIAKRNSAVLGLHIADTHHEQLPERFPNLFQRVEGTPIYDRLHERLSRSNFTDYTIETVSTTEWIASPADILKICSFGQHSSIYNELYARHIEQITTTYNEHTTTKGFPLTHSRYIVSATL